MNVLAVKNGVGFCKTVKGTEVNVVDAINFLEIPWWIGCGVFVAFRRRRSAQPRRWRGLLAAVSLLLFGLTDVVELQTGAWWRPWWLAVWKGACVVSLLICLLLHWRDVQHSRLVSAEASPPENESGRGLTT